MDQNTRDVLTLSVPILGTAFAAYIGYLTSKLRKDLGDVKKDVTVVSDTGKMNTAAIVEVAKQTDGLTTKLVETTKIASEAVGMQKEQAAQKARESLVAEGVFAGKAEQKDLQIKAAAGPVVPATVSSVKPGEGTK